MTAGRREALIVGAAALGAMVAGALVGALSLQSGTGAAQLLSTPFVDLSGRPRRLLEWQGRVVLCNFWATWCEPCREEVPLLVAAEQQHRARGLSIVGIGIDSVDKIREFSQTYGITYIKLIADAGVLQLLRRLGNTSGGLPYSVLLDRSGAVAYRKLGAFVSAELEQVLGSMLR